jgi:hypothetical protein
VRRTAIALAVSGLLLAACDRTRDSFSPKVIIQQPSGNAVRSLGEINVVGEAVDDHGIEHIFIKGRDREIDLLDYAEHAAKRGNRLVPFSFKGVASSSGRVGFTVRAVDVNGRETKVELPIQVDGVRPSHCISRLEPTEGGVVVAGRATDNLKVSRVYVNGLVTNISPGRSITFYAEIPYRATVEVVVQDGAGNRQYQQYRTPAEPSVDPSCAQ